MEAQQRHSPEPIIEEPFHHHIDQSASDILHDLTPEQTDLLKIQLQIATSSRLHLQPFSLEDDEAPSQLEHHIHPEDSGRSGEDLTPTGRLHHLGFGDPTGFEDDPALQIHHHHQPIYEDPTGGPYPFNLSPTSLSFDHPDLTQLHHHHPEQHTLPIQPVASSSTSSLDDTLKPGTAPIKKKLGRPSRKLRMEKGAEEECNGNGKGTSSGPTKRLRTVASLGDDTEKIEKLRAQGRERQRRKRERDRARAAGLVVEPELPLPKAEPKALKPKKRKETPSTSLSSPLSDPASLSHLQSNPDEPPIFDLDIDHRTHHNLLHHHELLKRFDLDRSPLSGEEDRPSDPGEEGGSGGPDDGLGYHDPQGEYSGLLNGGLDETAGFTHHHNHLHLGRDENGCEGNGVGPGGGESDDTGAAAGDGLRAEIDPSLAYPDWEIPDHLSHPHLSHQAERADGEYSDPKEQLPEREETDGLLDGQVALGGLVGGLDEGRVEGDMVERFKLENLRNLQRAFDNMDRSTYDFPSPPQELKSENAYDSAS